MLSEMPKMKKGKIIVMPPQNQNYFILLNDGGGWGRALVVSKAELQPLKKKSFSAKLTFNLMHARVSMSLLIFPQKYSASQL